MTPDDQELLDDAIALLRKMKNDDHLWRGLHGFTSARREDVNDLLKRHSALGGGA
jgi:hypothetical protein